MEPQTKHALGMGALMVAVAGAVYLAQGPSRFAPEQGMPLESPERMERIRAIADAGPTEPSYVVAFDPRYPDRTAIADASGALTFQNGLPPSKDGTHDFVGAFCGACHSINIVTQQRLTRERWDDLLDWMVEKQGMPTLEPDEEARVLDYLSANFGPAN